jgi:hypothetical protein
VGVALLSLAPGRKGVVRRSSREMEGEQSCGSIFHVNFIASCSGLVVRLHELVELRLHLSG